MLKKAQIHKVHFLKEQILKYLRKNKKTVVYETLYFLSELLVNMWKYCEGLKKNWAVLFFFHQLREQDQSDQWCHKAYKDGTC